MGITLQNSISSMDIPYSGMFRLRRDIARIIDKSLGVHYARLASLRDTKSFEMYDSYTEALLNKCIKKHGEDILKAFEFLYAFDGDGSVSWDCCEELLKVLTNKPSVLRIFQNTTYGYSGKSNPSRGYDFVRLLRECVKNKKSLEWF